MAGALRRNRPTSLVFARERAITEIETAIALSRRLGITAVQIGGLPRRAAITTDALAAADDAGINCDVARGRRGGVVLTFSKPRA